MSATILAALLVSSGCGLGPAGPKRNARTPVPSAECEVIVTRDFGATVIKRLRAGIEPGEPALSITRRHCKIETAYGGGFVKSLDGVSSRRPGVSTPGADWFFYVNGGLAGKGALEVPVSDGDVVWWDYHSWAGDGGMMQAVIGAWPKPFHIRSRILVSPLAAAAGQRLAGALNKGCGAEASVEQYDWSPIDERKVPTALVLLREEVGESTWVSDLFRHAWRAGLPGTVLDDGIVGLNSWGRPCVTWKEGSALVMATASSMGDAAPLWFIMGWDAQGLDRAVAYLEDTLRGGREAVPCAFGVAVTPGGVIHLPVTGPREETR